MSDRQELIDAIALGFANAQLPSHARSNDPREPDVAQYLDAALLIAEPVLQAIEWAVRQHHDAAGVKP